MFWVVGYVYPKELTDDFIWVLEENGNNCIYIYFSFI